MLLNDYRFKNQTFLGLHNAIQQRERELSQGHRQASDTALPSLDLGNVETGEWATQKGGAAAFKQSLRSLYLQEKLRIGINQGPR